MFMLLCCYQWQINWGVSPLVWVKKEEIPEWQIYGRGTGGQTPPLILAEGRKASRASKLKPHPLLSSKSRSATVTEGRKASRRRKTIPTPIPHPTPWSATGYSVIMSGCSHCKHNHYDVMYILLIVLPLCRQSELGSTIIVCIATDINLWLNCDLKKSRAESQ